MVKLTCAIDGKTFLVKNYRRETAKFCSRRCKSVFDAKRMTGNGFAVGRSPWNKNLKGIHLSPQSEFKAGDVPWNKDVKGIHLSPATEFKKGQRAINWRPVGTITTRPDRSGTKRKWIKVEEPNVWIEYARFIWLKAGRKIKEGYCLHHKNNDSSDDRLANLKYVSRTEHPKLHNRWNTRNKREQGVLI